MPRRDKGPGKIAFWTLALLRKQRWYLIAYDLTREDWRIFRLDRIEEVATSTGPHDPREPGNRRRCPCPRQASTPIQVCRGVITGQ